MPIPVRTNQFLRDYKLAMRQGRPIGKLDLTIMRLATGVPLEPNQRDHALQGPYRGCRECHLGGDWLLIYRLTGEVLSLERTGTHAELFE
jgi:mRNA interferase YafQ